MEKFGVGTREREACASGNLDKIVKFAVARGPEKAARESASLRESQQRQRAGAEARRQAHWKVEMEKLRKSPMEKPDRDGGSRPKGGRRNCE